MLSVKQEKAAAMVAADDITDQEIADKVGIGKATLERWKGLLEFKTRVTEIVDKTRQAIVTQGIADKVNRVRALNDRWERMQRLVEARAIEHANAPGGNTGLLVKTFKVVGTGPVAYEVEEYAADTALLRELRAHEEQAAKELGQWVEKKDVSGKLEIVDAKQALISKLDSVSQRIATGEGDSPTEPSGGGSTPL